jgi:hypothetical protein
MNTRFINLPGYETRYSISIRGEILSHLTGRLLTASKHTEGYRTVMLCGDDGRHRRLFVHTLVCLSFIGPRPSGHEIDHKNRDKTDNRKSNLQYILHGANQQKHAKRQMRSSSAPQSHFKGVHYLSNGVLKKWRAAITVNGRMEIIGRFDNDRDAAVAWDKRALQLRGANAVTNKSLGYLR